MNEYLTVVARYAEFGGRSRPREFWMFSLVNFLIYSALAFTEGFLGIGGVDEMGVPTMAYALALAIPSLAVGVRRLHDTNRSGWWMLLNLVPVIGFLVLIFFWIEPGDSWPNSYGPDPLADERNPAGPLSR